MKVIYFRSPKPYIDGPNIILDSLLFLLKTPPVDFMVFLKSSFWKEKTQRCEIMLFKFFRRLFVKSYNSVISTEAIKVMSFSWDLFWIITPSPKQRISLVC